MPRNTFDHVIVFSTQLGFILVTDKSVFGQSQASLSVLVSPFNVLCAHDDHLILVSFCRAQALLTVANFVKLHHETRPIAIVAVVAVDVLENTIAVGNVLEVNSEKLYKPVSCLSF